MCTLCAVGKHTILYKVYPPVVYHQDHIYTVLWDEMKFASQMQWQLDQHPWLLLMLVAQVMQPVMLP